MNTDNPARDPAEAPAPAAPAPAQVPPTTAKLFVAFAYVKAETKQERHGRAFIEGIVDIFTQAQVEQAEAMILRQFQDQGIENVTITNWKRLVA